MDVLREPEQDADAQLVIQEAALDVTAGSDPCARLKADEIADGDAEFANVFGGLDVFIEDDFRRLEGAFGILIIAVDMDGGVDQLEGAFVDAGEFRRDAAVLRLGVVRVQPADVLNAETAVRLDLRDHAAEGVRVRFKEDAAFRGIRSAEINDHAAFDGVGGFESQQLEFADDILFGLFGVAAGAVNGEKLDRLFDCVFHIFLFHSFSLISGQEAASERCSAAAWNRLYSCK